MKIHGHQPTNGYLYVYLLMSNRDHQCRYYSSSTMSICEKIFEQATIAMSRVECLQTQTELTELLTLEFRSCDRYFLWHQSL